MLSQDEARFPLVPTLHTTLGVKGYRPMVGTWDNKDQVYGLVAHWCFCDTHVQEPIAALLRFAATPGSDNPSSRNLSRRLCLWTRGSVVPEKMETAL